MTLKPKLHILLGITCASLISLLGCNTPSGDQATALKVPETNVNPEINDNFKAQEMDPSHWVERFEREGREVYDQRHEIVEAIGIEAGMDVADVGCGTGLYTFLFSDKIGPEGRVYAVDISEPFLNRVGGHAISTGRQNIQTLLASDTSSNLPPNSVDLVYICDTYHHFEFPHNTMLSIHQALRKGGQVVVVDFIREEGVSSEWTLNHVRAGKEVFTDEITKAGFELVEEIPLLESNYILRFRKS